jgi:ABC-type glycerol-3-phosphate transport system substrate-binding protein
MEEYSMKRFALMSVLLILGVTLIFAGGGQQSGGASSGGTGRDASGNLTYKGTITFYAQAYSPVDPTETNPNPPTAFKEVARKWAALNPGVEIEFFLDLGEQANWLRTKMAGGQAPDIFWAQYYELNSGMYPAGSFIPLTSYLDRPNKYAAGNTRWLDLFPDSLVQTVRAPNGDINVIDGDYVATQVVYNARMFRDAGITFEIKNWTDFTRACELLKAKGYTPWQYNFGSTGADYTTWLSRLMGTNLYYDNMKDLAVISGPEALTLSPLEGALGVKNGYFTSKDPRFQAWWPALKEHVEKYMPQDTVSAATTSDTIFSKFLNQEIAMYWDGSWAGNNLKAANCSFEYASFPFPSPDKASMPLASDFLSSGAVGGYSAAWQYAISSNRANSTMTDAKLEAAIDWLMYITTPENNETVVNDLGSFVPVIKGSTPTEANRGVASVLQNAPKVIDIGPTYLGTECYEGYYREFQSYLQGNLTLQQAGANIDRLFAVGADTIISQSGQDVSRYLK